MVMFMENINSNLIAIGIILNKSQDILIAKRLSNKPMGDLWEFPGGKKETGEDIEDTLKREIKEEVNIYIKVRKKLISFQDEGSLEKRTFYVFICDWVSGVAVPLASQEIKWIPLNQLKNYKFPKANKKIISEIVKYFRDYS